MRWRCADENSVSCPVAYARSCASCWRIWAIRCARLWRLAWLDGDEPLDVGLGEFNRMAHITPARSRCSVRFPRVTMLCLTRSGGLTNRHARLRRSAR